LIFFIQACLKSKFLSLKFNRRHFVDGQLFRGRHKSILIGVDSYILQLVRYIHHNPVRAGIVSKPDDYIWSRHKGYLSVAKKWKWLHKEFIFSLLTKHKKDWVKEYRSFVTMENSEEIAKVFESKKWPSILGPGKFIDWVKGKYYEAKANQEIPQVKELAPETEAIMNAVCEFYKVSKDKLYISKRGHYNEPRNVAIFLIRKLRTDSLKEIGHRFQMEKYSSISSIIERMKKQMHADRNLTKRVKKLANKVVKSQEQT